MVELLVSKFNEIVEFDVNMGKHTSFKTGGTAKFMFKPKTIDDLKEIVKELETKSITYIVIGNGSNILFNEGLFDGVVIKIGREFEFKEIDCEENKYRVSSGTMLVKFAKKVCDDGFEGMEFGTGIPGTVGGAVYMNAGCYGREIVDCIKCVKVLNKETLEIECFKNEKCEFSYRNSVFQNDKYIILGATFEFEKGDKTEIEEKVAKYKKSRTEKQPLNFPSGGSTFKRPKDDFAGRLIEVSGLKGYKIGGAMVSDKHAGFIINSGGASPKDIVELIDYVKKTVKEKTGVELELEIKII